MFSAEANHTSKTTNRKGMRLVTACLISSRHDSCLDTGLRRFSFCVLGSRYVSVLATKWKPTGKLTPWLLYSAVRKLMPLSILSLEWS